MSEHTTELERLAGIVLVHFNPHLIARLGGPLAAATSAQKRAALDAIRAVLEALPSDKTTKAAQDGVAFGWEAGSRQMGKCAVQFVVDSILNEEPE